MTLNVGLVGAGNHGARYLRHLVADVAGLAPVACSRRDEAAGRALAAELGLRWFADGDALVDDPEVQAVVIATPPSTHFRYAARALAAGKPVLVEKPLTGTLGEARALADLAARPGSPPLMVAHTLRWNPVLRRARELWPQLGRVHLVRLAQRLEPTTLAWQRDLAVTVGGSVLLTGVHLFDLARWLTGREVVRLDSRQRRIQNPVVEDLFLARGELDDGAWVSFEVSKYTRSRACWLEAVGEQGQLWVDYLDGEIILRRGADRHRETIDARTPTVPRILAAWQRAISGAGPVAVTVTDGLRTLEMTEACYVSAAENRAVDLGSL